MRLLETFADDKSVGFVTKTLARKEGDKSSRQSQKTRDKTSQRIAAGAKQGAENRGDQGGAAGRAASTQNGEASSQTSVADIVGIGGGGDDLVFFAATALLPDDSNQPNQDTLQNRDQKSEQPIPEVAIYPK